ncbi:unnamed protein product [Phyllotreta striolata]|uniref:Uncharacterized protein n=1 Tax=Phyllotreta striolata TaxID=444603 RepID=A0A9N9TVE5_PHYSR|nr:unnamed protein product [Phyllotreta striolata]
MKSFSPTFTRNFCGIMDARCRLCAECSTNQIAILHDNGFCLKIFQLFQIKVSANDNLPTCVCRDCYEMVEKTWNFNDRIQKAQDILAELINGIQETLPEIPELEESNNHANSTSIVDLDYMPQSKDEKCDFLTSESLEIFSEITVKSENTNKTKKSTNVKKKKLKTTKNDERKLLRKESQPENSQIEDIEFEMKLDGSIVQKEEEGWNRYMYSCTDCHSIFNNPDDIRMHYTNVHNAPTRYLCADCPKSYTKYSVFLTHVRIHRPRLRLCCDMCFKWFPTVSEQEKHRILHGETKPYVCATCGRKFRMQSSLIVHSRTHLPIEIKNQHQCDQCPKKFGTRPNLMAHMRIHSGIREYTCDQCGKSFVQKGNLDNHLLTHTAVTPFNCLVCNKSFKTLVRLRKHSSIHSGLKPHRCEICGRQFRERGTLKEHHRIHTGDMPFTCEFCGKCFRFKGVLTTHRRQHTGERPYSCNECQHHFTNWPNYNKHMKRRHGINTSVTCRTRQDIPPTGMPHRNPPGTVLAPPQPVLQVAENYTEPTPTFYPVLNLYTIPEELVKFNL